MLVNGLILVLVNSGMLVNGLTNPGTVELRNAGKWTDPSTGELRNAGKWTN